MVIVRENGNAMHGMQTREETLEGEKEIAGGIFCGRVRESRQEGAVK